MIVHLLRMLPIITIIDLKNSGKQHENCYPAIVIVEDHSTKPKATLAYVSPHGPIMPLLDSIDDDTELLEVLKDNNIDFKNIVRYETYNLFQP